MFFIVKIILVLAFLSGVFVYGETAWDSVKEKVVGFTDPELQRANLFDSFKNNYSEIEEIVRQVNENIDNSDFDKKTEIEKALNLIQESKDSLEDIGQPGTESLTEKVFDNLNDLKEGMSSLFTENKGIDSQPCQCSQEN